jgi:hypothetical protein
MIISKYTEAGFAALVINNKAQIIGAVKAGQPYAFNNASAQVIFNATLDGLTADLIDQGFTILN